MTRIFNVQIEVSDDNDDSILNLEYLNQQLYYINSNWKLDTVEDQSDYLAINISLDDIIDTFECYTDLDRPLTRDEAVKIKEAIESDGLASTAIREVIVNVFEQNTVSYQ